jgi:hypothetical protein
MGTVVMPAIRRFEGHEQHVIATTTSAEFCGRERQLPGDEPSMRVNVGLRYGAIGLSSWEPNYSA